MPPFDGQAFGNEIVAAVKAYVTPLIARIDTLEKELAELRDKPAPPPTPLDEDRVHEIVDQSIKQIPHILTIDETKEIAISIIPPVLTKEEIDRLISLANEHSIKIMGERIQNLSDTMSEQISDAISEFPAPPTVDQVKEIVSLSIPVIPTREGVEEFVGKMIDAAIKKSEDFIGDDLLKVLESKFLDWISTMKADISINVKSAIEALPKPKDGASVTLNDVRPMIEEIIAQRVAAIPPAKNGEDGIGFKTAIIDQDFCIVFTKTNGDTVKVGPVRGIAGKDGIDGLGFGDLVMEQLDDRHTVFKAKRDDKEKVLGTLVSQTMFYRYVFSEEAAYLPGDCVTWGGSLWHCNVETKGVRPGEGSKNWTLCVKRGQEGKAGKDLRLIPDKPVVKI